MTRRRHPGRSTWGFGLQAGFGDPDSAGVVFVFPPQRFRRGPSLCALGLIVGILQGAAAAAPESDPNAGCLDCHGDETLTMLKEERTIPLFTDREVLAKSPHGIFDCTDCHEGFDGDSFPHKQPMTPVNCSACHEDTGKKHPFHTHLAVSPMPAGDDTSCTVCHGTHAIAAVKSTEFPFARTQQTESCGRCHLPARDHFLSSAHGRVLAAGAAEAPDCLDCHRHSVVPPTDGRRSVELKLTQTRLCESCHLEKPEVADKTLLGTRFVSSFDRSVHGAALQRGNGDAANCVDCHGSHEMNQAMVAGARVNKLHLADTCAKCHEAIATKYAGSVHAVALARGNLDSPMCTDCHGEHDIRAHTDPASRVHAKNLAQQVCATCHASLRLTEKYGLATNTFRTFSDSYHGLAVRGGAVEVVNCASCHDSHAIKSHLDPASSVHPDNLVATCGQCHPGANTRFTIGRVHVSPEEQREGSLIIYWIAQIYVVLIAVVVGGMFAHNLLDFVKKIRRKLAVQKGLIGEERVAHRLYLRMTAHERVQHGLLALSFVLLVISGFMLRYPEAWWVVAIRHLSSGAFEWRSLIHRGAGVVLLLVGAWHIAYLAFTTPGRALLHDLWPSKRDFIADPWKVLKYNLGLAGEKPRFGRFSYIEKVEYWALVWGTMLMGATGVILWFENTSMGLFTKLGFDISRTIHFYEAILATFAIVVWHFYFVIFNPDVYPMNLAWLTGRMSEREMLEEHPAELDRLKAAGSGSIPPADSGRKNRSAPSTPDLKL